MDLQTWTEQNQVSDRMYYKGGADAQFKQFAAFAKSLGEGTKAEVVSSHRSKSIELPVVEFTTNYGVRCIARDNFHDIKVSVWVPAPCDSDLFGLTAGGDSYLSAVYFEGFRPEWVNPSFVLGADKFSISLGWKELIPFAIALRWKYGSAGLNEYARDALLSKEPYFLIEEAQRTMAKNAFFPLIYRVPSITGLYRFFDPGEDMEPNEAFLRTALTKAQPRYDGKVEPVLYIDLDFSAGCPRPHDKWLTVLNKLVAERRTDPNARRLGGGVGARVNVLRLTPELRKLAETLGLTELLTQPDHH